MSTPGPGICGHCGAALPPPKQQGRRRQFCNATCRSKARRRRAGRAGPALASRPFAAELSDAVRGKGLPLREISAQLERDGYYLSTGALSQWQNGRTVPYPTVETGHRLLALERTLAVPPGSLIAALERTSRGRPAPDRPQDRRLPANTCERGRRRMAMERKITAAAGSDRRYLVLVSQQEHFRIGRYRRPASSHIELTGVALRDQIAAYWYLYEFEPAAPTVIEPLAGCRVGRILHEEWHDPTELRFDAVELRFAPERALHRGEQHTFSYRVRYLDAENDDIHLRLGERIFRRLLPSPACRELHLSVEFDADGHLPLTLTQCRWDHRSDRHTKRTPTELTGRRDELRLANPRPGAYGWEWAWSADDQIALPVGRR
jgi:hypothetical protein